jgi:hypothetical protein
MIYRVSTSKDFLRWAKGLPEQAKLLDDKTNQYVTLPDTKDPEILATVKTLVSRFGAEKIT